MTEAFTVTPASGRLDLQAIERSLREVQAHFNAVNARILEKRDPFLDAVRDNMVAGYALADSLATRGIDLFSLKNVGCLLDINTTVLCGNDPVLRQESAAHIAATEERFYAEGEGSIKSLLEWYGLHRHEDTFLRAAGVYIHILSKPQLFIEGNHRSGSLIMSYILMREGRSPFVLRVDNAEAYFNPSTVIRNLAKHGLKALLKTPLIRRRYADFLRSQCRRNEGLYLRGTAAKAARCSGADAT